MPSRVLPNLSRHKGHKLVSVGPMTRHGPSRNVMVTGRVSGADWAERPLGGPRLKWAETGVMRRGAPELPEDRRRGPESPGLHRRVEMGRTA
jgi:hypothetical protein